MKILIHCPVPFALAHGGAQIQIQRTHDALREAGVEADYLRWYDETQTGDILHFFGRAPVHILKLAQQKRMKVVMLDLLTAQGSRPKFALKLQGLVMRLLQYSAPRIASNVFGWSAYQLADACVANTPYEKELMRQLFGAPEARVHVVPNGVEAVF